MSGNITRAAGYRPLIWLVDDSPTQVAFTERSLGPDYRYEHFEDGTTVIERLVGNCELPDLVLLDWVMPGLSGDDVCRHVRALPRTADLPIIMFTASRIATEDVVLALECGADDYVAKPFVSAELRARVATILRAGAERRRLEALNDLSAALLHADGVAAVVQVIEAWLVPSFADKCFVAIVPGEASEAEPTLGGSDVAMVVKSIPLRSLARGSVTLLRTNRAALGPRDHAAIDTCLEYSALALETALRRERDRATTRFHEEMLGIVSHDLKGPLGALKLGLEVLGQDPTVGSRSATLARMVRSANRMDQIIALLLDVTRSRIGNGIDVHRALTSLHEVIRDVLDEVRASAPTMRFELVGDDVVGDWDRGRLGQLVSNLVSNAAQYGRPGGTVRLMLKRIDDCADVRVHNENRGAPIDADVIATMFDPFKRGHTTGNLAGLGLGLYIVHQIVLAHRGEITVSSDDSGTTFRLLLPIRAPALK